MKRNRDTVPLFRFMLPFGSIRVAPTIETGTTGAPEAIARKNGPLLNGSSDPSRDRVPSGNSTRQLP